MRDNLRFKIGPGDAVANIYPYYYAKMFWDSMTKAGVEPFNLIRFAWAGSQCIFSGASYAWRPPAGLSG